MLNGKTSGKSNAKIDEEEKGCKLKKSSFSQLLDAVSKECRNLGMWNDQMQRDLPKKWEKHGSLILLPENCFTLPEWRMCGGSLWKIVADAMQTGRLGRKRRITADDYHTPHIELLYGPDGWVEHIDNDIRYQYDITKTMLSIANSSEKSRIAQFECRGEVVVDMFSGLGYFTLPFLVHAKAAHVHSIDWNADAMEALIRNIQVNEVEDKCSTYLGDCRKMCPQLIADRVYLGLIPTCRHYWLYACKALKPEGGFMHIHETVDLSPARHHALKQLKDKRESVENIVPNGVANGDSNGSIVNLNGINGDSNGINGDSNGINGDSKGMNGNSNPVISCDPAEIPEAPPKRKPSRSASILEELESRPIPEPIVDPKYNESDWEKLPMSYRVFALEAASKCSKFINNIHEDRTFSTSIMSVTKIKNYSPQVDHVVLDLKFSPAQFYK